MIHIYIQVHALGPSFIEPARYVKITIYIFYSFMRFEDPENEEKFI